MADANAKSCEVGVPTFFDVYARDSSGNARPFFEEEYQVGSYARAAIGAAGGDSGKGPADGRRRGDEARDEGRAARWMQERILRCSSRARTVSRGDRPRG